jgi:hypothetical protein
MNGNLRAEKPETVESREWNLGSFQGQEIDLTLIVQALGGGAQSRSGVVWDAAQPRPLVEALPSSGHPIAPQIRLDDLQPVTATVRGRPLVLQSGQTAHDKRMELAIRDYVFRSGFGVPTGSEITYELSPSWTRFVSIIGLADGSGHVGPYELLLDGQPFWKSTSPDKFGRNSPGKQIDIPIPAGHKTVTLRLSGGDSYGAWAMAGFRRD